MSHRCHSDAHCTNSNGSYNCMCKDGFSGDGYNCTGLYCVNLLCFPQAAYIGGLCHKRFLIKTNNKKY